MSHTKGPSSPCVIKKGRRGKKKEEGSFTSIQMLHTHTPGRAGKTLKGKRKKKADTTGRRPKNSAGGEGNRRTSGTNLHGETGLTKNRAHT